MLRLITSFLNDLVRIRNYNNLLIINVRNCILISILYLLLFDY